ncbi:expressed unknown protein [Seminavis robusta]|uniref:Uncharacterized protein n=1 Tax=Seminavis robusta TaxID=568900 RepID=A0A9N8E4X6_9STRA|nr:expressed unknown protein [Seminavis robusta]|eukprot:Sro553_g165380.1 n/a (251) ;mRNA; f:46588-47419
MRETWIATSALVSPEDIQAFREFRLDWHNLIPRGIESPEKLAATETEVTKALLQFEDSISDNICALQDKDHASCIRDPSCTWIEDSKSSCRVSSAQDDKQFTLPRDEPAEVCHNGSPLVLRKISQVHWEPQSTWEGCTSFSPLRVLRIELNSNAKDMFFHFMRNFLKPFMYMAHRDQYLSDMDMPNVIVLTAKTKFLRWFALFTDYCPRLEASIPVGVCVCETGAVRYTTEGSSGNWCIPEDTSSSCCAE